MADQTTNPDEIELTIEGKLIQLFPTEHELKLSNEHLTHMMRHPTVERVSSDSTELIVHMEVPSPLLKDEEQRKVFVSKIASVKLELALEDGLKDYVKYLEDHKFTEKVEAATCAWQHQAKQPQGPFSIADGLNRLLTQVRTQMGESTNYSGNRFALAVPFSHVPYLQSKNSVGESAFAMFQTVLPQVELMAVPQLYDKKGNPCVLLLCTSEAYGPAGYMALHGKFYFRKIEDKQYSLSIPKHHLVLANPEQMAVLTGI